MRVFPQRCERSQCCENATIPPDGQGASARSSDAMPIDFNESDDDINEEEEPQPNPAAESFGLVTTTNRTASEWAQCDRCQKWRRLPKSVAASSLPDIWFCSMSADAERNTCSAAEEHLRYGTGGSSVEHEDRSVLPTEFEGVQLIMSESSATGYEGVFLEHRSKNESREELPFRVEYGGGPNGEVMPKCKSNRKTKHFATNVEAAAWCDACHRSFAIFTSFARALPRPSQPFLPASTDASMSSLLHQRPSQVRASRTPAGRRAAAASCRGKSPGRATARGGAREARSGQGGQGGGAGAQASREAGRQEGGGDGPRRQVASARAPQEAAQGRR